MSIIKSGIPIALCVATAALSCTASWAQDTASSCKSVTSVQRRIVERADQGIESLRAFVGMTKFIYGVDMIDVQASLDTWRAAVECQKQVAQAAAEAEAGAKVAHANQ